MPRIMEIGTGKWLEEYPDGLFKKIRFTSDSDRATDFNISIEEVVHTHPSLIVDYNTGSLVFTDKTGRPLP